MVRILSSAILCLALTGCGEVVVFGHVVRENPAKTEAAASKPATEPTAPPKPATEVAPPAPAAEVAAQAGAALAQPATEVAAQPATEVAPLAPATAIAVQAATEAAPPNPVTEVAAAPEAAAASSSTQAARQTTAAAPGLPTAHLLRAVNVTLSPDSQAGNASVDAAALLDAIRTELKSRSLLDEQNPSADGTAEVLIESATTRRTVNAVVFGRQPMAGTLTGELRVSGSSGERPSSKIVAESRFSIADDGQDKNALGPLYRRFAVLTADELTGIAPN